MSSESEHQLIADASDRVAHLVLMELCTTDSVMRRKAAAIIGSGSRLPTPPAASAPGQKRKAEAQTVNLCTRCEKLYTADSATGKGVCVAHDGELEPDDDSDFWADHDEDCHGTIDTEEMRLEFPEGFIWTCCDKNGLAPGCAAENHHEPIADGVSSEGSLSADDSSSPAPKKAKAVGDN